MSKYNVTVAEYEEDLKNTKKELEAYEKIADGFQALAELPENASQNARFIFNSIAYQDKARRCREFLQKLEQIDRSELK